LKIRLWQVLAFIPLQAALAQSITTAQAPAPGYTGKNEERIAPCSIDFLVQLPSGAQCYLGTNRVGPFCTADQQRGVAKLQRCSSTQVEAAIEAHGGQTGQVTLGLLYRVALEGVRQ